jgi:SAM-dependent methyltransferase
MLIKECRVCAGKNLKHVLNLGNQPWCNDFQVEDGANCVKYPLATCFCEGCSTFQVEYTVPKEIMYKNHTYLSGANSSMPAHFATIAKKCYEKLNSNAQLVVDIGSNDGTLLTQFKKLNFNVLGVEPCVQAAAKAVEFDVPTLNDFFTSSIAENIKKNHGQAQIISAANVFYHVEELHDIVDGVKTLLEDDGTFIIQGTYLPTLLENNEFDIIYHEHLLYYRIENLNYLLKKHGLEIFDVDFADVHGGSFVAYAGHTGVKDISSGVTDIIQQERDLRLHTITPYLEFRDRVINLKSAIKGFVSSLKKQGKTIYAYGAPAKGTVMINFCELDSDTISLAVEVNQEKIGTYMPGTSIRVVDESKVQEPDYYFLLSWNFLEVFKNHSAYKSGIRRFIVPVPNPVVVSHSLES